MTTIYRLDTDNITEIKPSSSTLTWHKSIENEKLKLHTTASSANFNSTGTLKVFGTLGAHPSQFGVSAILKVDGSVGDSREVGFIFGYQDSSNYYSASLNISNSGDIGYWSFNNHVNNVKTEIARSYLRKKEILGNVVRFKTREGFRTVEVHAPQHNLSTGMKIALVGNDTTVGFSYTAPAITLAGISVPHNSEYTVTNIISDSVYEIELNSPATSTSNLPLGTNNQGCKYFIPTKIVILINDIGDGQKEIRFVDETRNKVLLRQEFSNINAITGIRAKNSVAEFKDIEASEDLYDATLNIFRNADSILTATDNGVISIDNLNTLLSTSEDSFTVISAPTYDAADSGAFQTSPGVHLAAGDTIDSMTALTYQQSAAGETENTFSIQSASGQEYDVAYNVPLQEVSYENDDVVVEATVIEAGESGVVEVEADTLLVNDETVATQNFVSDAIANAPCNCDLTPFATTVALNTGLATKAASDHNHDDRYYTEAESDAALSLKANSADLTAAVTTVNGALSLKADQSTLTNSIATVNTAIATKADQVALTSSIAIVNSSIATKADTATVNAALSAKADTAAVNSALALKSDQSAVDASIATVNASIATKADQSALTSAVSTINSAVALKADTSAVNNALALKADQSAVDASIAGVNTTLATKADTSAVNTALALKADQSAVDASIAGVNTTLATKADTSAVNNALALKADQSAVDASIAGVNTTLATKADTSAVNTALALKADTAAVNTALALKADTSAVNAALAGKSDVGHNHDERYYTETESDAALALKASVARVAELEAKLECVITKLESKKFITVEQLNFDGCDA